MGVKIDIDLRQAGEGTAEEKQAAEKLGMKYINIPFAPLSAPTDEQIARVLSLLTQNPTNLMFLHCRRGKDRTGTAIACYRIQHDGWDHRRALAEARQYGMSFAERGMKSYIIHFSPISPLAGSHPFSSTEVNLSRKELLVGHIDRKRIVAAPLERQSQPEPEGTACPEFAFDAD